MLDRLLKLKYDVSGVETRNIYKGINNFCNGFFVIFYPKLLNKFKSISNF